MMQSDRRDESRTPNEITPDAAVPVSAVPVAAAAPSRSGLMSIPLISGICCLGLILFLIASTIVLALIPLYTRDRSVTLSTVEADDVIDVPIDSTVPLTEGTFNDAQNKILQDQLQQQLNSDSATSDATVSVLSAATSAATGRRKRRASSVTVRIRITFRGPRSRRTRITIRLRLFVLNANIVIRLNVAGTTTSASTTSTTRVTTTSVTTTTNSTSNRTRRLVRRSMEEGGAPAGVVYIDSNQVAAIKGDVSTVSFYADASCVSAIIEFGAFELLNRDLEKNTAELRLVHKSGQLKITEKNKLKPFMNMIDIDLCGKKHQENCQGHEFPILAHQYIGVRSDKCRLGFAPVTEDPVFRTTLTAADQSDAFEHNLDKVNYIPADYTVLHAVTIDSHTSATSDADLEQHVGASKEERVLFVGSYPPRQCGIAKFLEDLTDAYPGPHSVVAVDEDAAAAKSRVYPSKVIYRLNLSEREAYFKIADMVNSEAFDVLNIQHEYGLYGGMLGEYVIGMLAAVRKPVITTMHTIVPDPSSMFLSVTRAICATSTRVIVMSEVGRRILVEKYNIDPKKISVVAHGVPDVPFVESTVDAKEAMEFDGEAPTMTTFGLLHRNKNIEVGLAALAEVVKTIPNLKYYIIGETHPAVISQEGESYRHALEANVTSLGLKNNVEFVDKYVSDKELLKYLAATDIYLTPYGREDQYVSGTLSWAVGLGKAVVSTPYLYAKDLLADGRGFLFPFHDSAALADLLVQIIENDKLRNEARHRAYQRGRYMTWNSVAIHIQAIVHELVIAANN